MKNRLVIVFDYVRHSYWFIPSLMSLLAVVLSFVTVETDKSLEQDLGWVISLVYVDSAESARAVLSTVASSMITVAGVVFSLTMVVLSLTSQQYGPWVLTEFMRDRGNQLVLGIFTATFIFCLLVLRTIRGGEDNLLVPHISVMTGLALSIVSLAMLIYFIHHVAESIQATNIIIRVSNHLLDGIDEIFPEELGYTHETEKSRLSEVTRQRLEMDGTPIRTNSSGYLQFVDSEKLFQVAQKRDLVVQIVEQPGHFFVQGDLLAHIISPQTLSSDVTSELEKAFILGAHRNPTQDIEFLLIPLVSIAVRALSPGINDPYTAIMCLDRIGEALCRLLRRRMPSSYRYDEAGSLRVISDPVPFETLFYTSFDQIRQFGRNDSKIVIHLLKTVNRLRSCTNDRSHYLMMESYMTACYEEARLQVENLAALQQFDREYIAFKHG